MLLENFQDSDCYLFAPGTHNISSAPLLLATLPATKNQSDKRFRYLTASLLISSSVASSTQILSALRDIVLHKCRCAAS